MRARIDFAASHFQPSLEFFGRKAKAFAVASFVRQTATLRSPTETDWRLA